MPTRDLTGQNPASRIWDIVEKARVGMLTTQFGGGLRARPLQARPDRDAGIIWFITDVRGAKDDEIGAAHDVGLVFVDERDRVYLSVTGRANVMHEASKLRPVVIDESLTDLDSLLLAREMGYTGVALKACKGQSQAMLMAAAARKYQMFVCVQDLTCPGASLIHSVGISAHVPAVAGIEANARQYVPAANEPWARRFPGIFTVTDGYMRTGDIGGPGLGIPVAMT